MSSQYCERCKQPLRPGRSFALQGGGSPRTRGGAAPPAPDLRCLKCALRHRGLLRRSLMVSLVVGTILTLLNQGDTLLAARWNNALYWQIPLTYCVPFLVATYGALTNTRK